jgi:hypothetical protein
MPYRIDTSARGYRYMNRYEQSAAKGTQWLGTIQTPDGEIGALGLTAGAYYLYSSGRRPIELEAAKVQAALAHPEHINPRGRKTGANGPQKPHSVTMDSKTREDAKAIGDGNLSLGVRLAVEFVTTQVHPGQFERWKAEQGVQ